MVIGVEGKRGILDALDSFTSIGSTERNLGEKFSFGLNEF